MSDRINLDKNENFFDFSTDVLKSIERFDFEELRKYPEQNSTTLCNAIAYVFSLEANNVLASNGRYEAFNYILNVFASKKNIIINYPASNIYFSICKRLNIQYNLLYSSYDYTRNLNEIDKTKNSLVIISNPNSITGAHIPIEEIDLFLKDFNGMLVIDEAYADFSLQSSYMLIKKYNNLIIVRSLSYSHSLAGLRLAFILSCKENMDLLYGIKDSYNINTITQIIASVAIKNTNTVKNNILALINERTFLDNELSKLGFLVLPSKANFLFVRPLVCETSMVFKYLLNENIIVKNFEDEQLKQYLRITVGERKDNIILVSKIKTFLKNSQAK